MNSSEIPTSSLTREEIKQACMIYGRMSPIEKWMNVVIEIGFLAPYFSSKPPKGLDPTFYHTGSYKGDMEQYEKLVRLVRRGDEWNN